MKIPQKTLNSGFSLPVLGLGTWHMGGSYERDDTHDREYIVAIERALAAGITHIDTAEMYALGHSEELVGQAIKNVDRSSVLITSKVWHNHLRRADVIAAVQGSLKRLGTTYLDLCLIHWPNAAVPLRETLGAFDELVDQSLVRAIGVSNFGPDLLAQAQQIARHPIVTDQVHYNLVCREPEYSGLVEYCTQNDVLITAYRPLKPIAQMPAPILVDLAKIYGKTPTQIAINWLIQQPWTVTIPKMTSQNHINDCLGSLGWALAPSDVDRLSIDYPGQLRTSDVIPRI